jgi:hypothetical protein
MTGYERDKEREKEREGGQAGAQAGAAGRGRRPVIDTQFYNILLRAPVRYLVFLPLITS